MKKQFILMVLVGLSVIINSCGNTANPKLTANDIAKVIDGMTDLMIHDVTNPPLASRFFTYTCLAGYEVVSQNDKKTKSLHGVLNEYPVIDKPARFKEYDYHLSAILAMYETAGKLQPSGTEMIKQEQAFVDSCRNLGFDDAVIDSSKSYAKFISKKILAYAKSDKYNRISNYARYKESAADSGWHPTPPAYMLPVEPYFNTIRTATLDSASQFLPPPPIPFSTNKGSPFYKFLQLSYQKSGKGLSEKERLTAAFWDCNPFAVESDGHMQIGLKKISPGAHWMGITSIACNKAKADFNKAMQVHTVVAIGLLDGFICCWDDKYRTNRIRPETAIRKYIDPNWKPLLQTPPFPEYISGHSVISAASAVILTHYFGDKFEYIDNVEQKYGLAPRKFTSFTQAANEAAISRFYGGIHFMDAIDNGVIQGRKVGNWVINKINSNK
ncbi:phosphatase PAP2 family protein [Mucilaginibacter terrenus]|uniref:Phosphatase PAP2 family protein n=1 Tax=Mucilaginibacter terrenus TaxID=2482727 RepID=A0A3E2NTV2_9SPHI|nr:vanadium-dependent haloperoxidase [Mucilaginibacter terrenus]RFZ84399.1 phosphatase PAP2 family protein [Mucilaginibacter terrenus]